MSDSPTQRERFQPTERAVANSAQSDLIADQPISLSAYTSMGFAGNPLMAAAHFSLIRG